MQLELVLTMRAKN